jgi:DNA-binding response OmpR family regulator/signal transduction histidine kinase
LPRPTLLCVDDESNVLDLLTRTFEKRFEVLKASSGPEALEILKTKPVDLMITDQRMPEMTGIELIKTAREAGIDITAILLTAYTNPEDIIAAINEGRVYRYVTKPFDLQDLSQTVRNAVDYVTLRKEKDRLMESLHKRIEALNVLYEVSRGAANDAYSFDAVVDRLLSVVGRVLPHDVSAVLLQTAEGRSASLRIRCRSVLSEKALLTVKESVLAAHRKAAGVLLPEERVLTRIAGNTTPDANAPANFPSALSVPLISGGQTVGTLSIFASQGAYVAEDGELLDLLVNQTTDAIDHLRAAESRSRRQIEALVESMDDGVALLDDKNEVVVLNPAARAILKLGDDPDHLTARHLKEKLGFSPWEMVRGWEYGGQKAFHDELKLFERSIALTVTPVADQDALRGVALVLRDVTEQKLLEERKDEFVSMVSHELRTPLTSITGALDLVLNHITGDVNEKQQRFLEMARESTEKLNALVDDLLDLSKFAKGKLKMAFEFTHLDTLVKKAVDKYGPAFGEKQVTPILKVVEGVNVLADPNRLEQVLNNLLTNATKFTPEGGEVTIELKAEKLTPGFVTLSVSNNGDSIAEDDLERIFDRFEQARATSRKRIRGTGLGLSICRNIVEAHGGRIWAEPAARGARFVAVLPIEPPMAVLEPSAEPIQKHTGPKPVRGNVLVIEDTPEIAWIMKAMLLTRGYKVSIASSADEGLALARKLKPDVITVDIKLPDVDGLKLAEIFRHDPETRQAQVMIVSGFDEKEAAMRVGARGFLLKPIQADALLASVDGLLSTSSRKKGKVLVVDDDAQIRAICGEVLHNLGFDAVEAGNVAQAKAAMRTARFDLLLLDVSLPDGDGFTLFEELKAERASAPLSVIFISARTETSAKVRALKLGGDDYLTKPFDALELGARVETVLRRRSQEAASSPTTLLPGSAMIEKEVQRRIDARQAFAFCYLDLDNLKAYNDYYGFAKADGVVRQTGDLLREIFALHGAQGDFLGHVAGDDFVFVASQESVDRVCQQAVETFDRIIPLYYDRADREKGFIEADDRFGQRRKFPIMSVSVVAVITDGRGTTHSELARMAADLKKAAKAVVGSVYLRSDRPLKAVPETA